MSTSPKWMRGRRVVGLTAGLVTTALIATLIAATSAAASTWHYGKGRWIGGWWMGNRVFVVNGHSYSMDCLIISGSIPNITKVSFVPAIKSIVIASGKRVTVGTVKTQELMTVQAETKAVANLANPKKANDEAAAIYIAENRIVGIDSTKFKNAASHASTAIKNEATRLVNVAKAHHGKSTLTLKVTRTPARLGDMGTVVAHVTNNPAGRVVTFSFANGLITASAKTNSNGDAAVHFFPTKGGSGYLHAAAHGLTPGTLGIGNYRPGQQAMITNSPRLLLRATAHYTTGLHRLTVNCPVTCDGTDVPVKGTTVHNYTAAYEHLSATVQRTTNGTTKTVSLGSVAVKPGTTLTHDWRANDGDKNLVVKLSGTWGGHAFSITIAKLAVVDCPRFTKLVVVQDVFCNCSKVVIGGQGDGKTIGAPIANDARTTLTFTFSDNAGHSFTKAIPAGQSIPALSYTVNKSQYTYSVTETLPYATHSGTRTLAINGSTSVSVS